MTIGFVGILSATPDPALLPTFVTFVHPLSTTLTAGESVVSTYTLTHQPTFFRVEGLLVKTVSLPAFVTFPQSDVVHTVEMVSTAPSPGKAAIKVTVVSVGSTNQVKTSCRLRIRW
jgi:hypothetical protein